MFFPNSLFSSQAVHGVGSKNCLGFTESAICRFSKLKRKYSLQVFVDSESYPFFQLNNQVVTFLT